MNHTSVDALIVLSGDPHQSEYPPDHWQTRAWISGFTGSAGTAIVTLDHARVYTDGRYSIQVEQETAASSYEGVILRQQGAPEYIDWLQEILPSGAMVATDGWCLSATAEKNLRQQLATKGIQLRTDLDIVGAAWEDRPALPEDPVFSHDLEYAIIPRKEKLNNLRAATEADYLLFTALDEIAWALNLRGNDVACNPVFLSYLLLNKEGATLYINNNKLAEGLRSDLLAEGLTIAPYDQITEDIAALPEDTTIQYDPATLNLALSQRINAQRLERRSPAMHQKAIKSPAEIEHIHQAMKKDGVALARAFYWLEQELQSGRGVTEVALGNKLAEERAKMPGYHQESFNPIVGYKGNGAIIHYRAEPETCAEITATGMLLVDSGAQYVDGTTDITRTFSLGDTRPIEKLHYTLVLKGMIALTRARYPEGTRGVQLDSLARQFLWEEGLDYAHGTGHGVGYYMNVHEPPQGFTNGLSERGKTVLRAGMISSNEPGYYLADAYGIRIENLVVTSASDTPGFLHHETLTIYPLDRRLIDTSRLTEMERDWIDEYHYQVASYLCPLLEKDIAHWIEAQCAPLP